MSNRPRQLEIAANYHPSARANAYRGDCLHLLHKIPDKSASLVVTSPPYNIGKAYEKRRAVQAYIDWQRTVITECHRILKNDGSICWQVGNYVENGSILPIDILLHPVFADLEMKMRNRIVWHFEHGLHCSQRLSGRYEVIVWYSKTDDYFFNVDPIRVRQKYPGKKHFKGPNVGKHSCNT